VKVHDAIDADLEAFIAAQKVFFVATAPSGAEGHVNCSPKGLDSLRVLGPRSVVYLDRVGSGVETIAHVRDNGRIVLMFCAFEGPPKILRLHGQGRIVEPGDDAFADLLARFDCDVLGVRAFVCVEVTRVADACGFGVPLYRYEGEREQLLGSAKKKGPERMADYQRQKNARSIDGLEGLRWIAKERA
jgi:hypothetical protein